MSPPGGEARTADVEGDPHHHHNPPRDYVNPPQDYVTRPQDYFNPPQDYVYPPQPPPENVSSDLGAEALRAGSDIYIYIYIYMYIYTHGSRPRVALRR